MNRRPLGWTDLLRREGSDFLAWLDDNHILSLKFDVLSRALHSLLNENIRTAEDAFDVWSAAPAVLACCNKQSTYEKPGAALAYAWQHLLDRYVRSWQALEILVEQSCLPMGRYGVNALDVGTGPGSSALAIIDFYTAMIEYSKWKESPKWHQTIKVTCVELDQSTNSLRHHLAELIHQQSQQTAGSVFQIGGGLTDFGKIKPTQERKKTYQGLLNAEETYFDEVAGQWTSDQLHLPDEAHYMAQSLHRYRLFAFSNFFTTVEVVDSFDKTLKEILRDADPGSAVLVIGGKGKPYPDVYDRLDKLARPAGFQQTISGEEVSSSNSAFAGRIYKEQQQIYDHIHNLTPNKDAEISESRKLRKLRQEIRDYYEASRSYAHRSQIRAYRKYRSGKWSD